MSASQQKIGPPLHFMAPIWGETYVATYLNYALPAQLAPRNIPVLSDGRSRYTIYTTRADYERIERDPIVNILRNIVALSVEFIDSEIKSSDNKYSMMSECHRRGLRQAVERDEAAVFLNADIILADGFIQTAADMLVRGMRAIEVAAPRGLIEAIGPTLRNRYCGTDGRIIISPVELSALCIKYLHPLMEMHVVEGSDGGKFHPSQLFWRVGDEGILARCFHTAPIVIHPGSGRADFSTTIDDDLTQNLGLSDEQVYFADDSRKMFCCELSPRDQYVGHMAYRGDLKSYVAFYKSYGGAKYIRKLTRPVVIAGVRELGPQWDVRARESLWFVQRVISACRRAVVCDAFATRILPPLREALAIMRRSLPKSVKTALKLGRKRLTGG